MAFDSSSIKSLAYFYTFLGGIILFVIGMVRTSEGMQQIADSRLRHLFSHLFNNRLKGSLAGLLIAFLTQSPATTAVLTIGFVNNGIITLVDGITLILGSNIGASLILQFAISNSGWIFFPLLSVSLFLRYLCRQSYLRDVGFMLFGLSLLMLGLTIMTYSLDPLRQNEYFIQSLDFIHLHIIFGFFCTVVLTIIVQNSTAVIALTIALASSGHLLMADGFVLILGANLGACAPTVFSSLHGTLASRRVAVSQLLMTVVAVAMAVLFFDHFLQIASYVSPGEADLVILTAKQSQWYQLPLGQKPFVARHLVNAYTLFTLFTMLLFWPLFYQVARLSTYLIHGRDRVNDFGLQFIDARVLNTPPVALSQARSELRRMARTAGEALHETGRFIDDLKGERLPRLTRYENLLDLLQKELTGFLVDLSHRSSSYDSAHEVALMIHMVSDFERIGDHCQSLVRLSQRKETWGVTYSDQAQRDMALLMAKTMTFVDYVISALDDCPDDIAISAKDQENSIDSLEEKMRNDHLQRLTTGECAVRPGLIFIDMVQSFEQISDHAYSIAKCLSGDRK